MPLEDLLNLEVKTNTLTGIKIQALPASVTTITSEDIERTPARNIFDLMEVYAPGVTWVNHYDGPHMGIRFAPTDRNYKYLLLVNGVNMNQKSHNGATSELENWDLADIEKIEIIRGPGSVAYGSGAILGVINIITKQAKNALQTNAQLTTAYPYNTYGGNVSCSFKKGRNRVFVFGSAMKLGGYENANMYRVETTPEGNFSDGYIGKGQQYCNGVFVGDAPPLTYMKSRLPQMKIHLGINLGKQWELMARYTTSDVIGQYVFPKTRQLEEASIIGTTVEQDGTRRNQYAFNWGPYTDYAYVKHKVAMAAIKNRLEIDSRFTIDSKISATNHDYDFAWNDYYFRMVGSPDSLYKYHELGSMVSPQPSFVETGRNWSENEICVSELFNWNPFQPLKMAVGAELANTRIEKGWGDSNSEMITGDNWDILSDSNSVYVIKNGNQLASNSIPDSIASFINRGFTVNTISLFSESNLQVTKKITMILSARLDKNQYVKFLFSPRIAIIAELPHNNYIKIIAQQSKRMNTITQLYLGSKNGEATSINNYSKIPVANNFGEIGTLNNKGSDNETIKSVELIFSSQSSKRFHFNLPTYINFIDNLGIKKDPGAYGAIHTYRIGQFTCAGVEPEMKFFFKHLTAGINHSFYKPLHWKLDKSTDRNLSSVGGWHFKTTIGDKEVVLTSSSNNLMMWSNQSTKTWVDFYLLKKRITLHIDARCAWKYEGGKDMLDMYTRAANGTTEEAKVRELVTRIENKGVFDADFRLNAGVVFTPSKHLSVSLMAQNIASTGKAKRYTLWEFWHPYPNPAFVEEPLALFAKVKVSI